MKEKLRVENIIAEEGGIKLLDDFYLSLEEGETVGLYIKESRIKNIITDILDGVHEPLNGFYFLDDQRIETLTNLQKIHVVEGESKLIDGMTIADNIFVIRSGFKEQFIHDRILNQQAKRLLMELHIDLDPRLKINQLTSFEKVQIELAKAYGLGYEVIVLKDMSAYFSDENLELLKDLMNYMRTQNKSFVMIDSFYDILTEFSSQVIWVKHGKSKWILDSNLPEAFVKELFLDSVQDEKYVTDKKPVFQFKNITCDTIKNFDMTIYKGEIVNIFDRSGTGLNTLKQLILGNKRTKSGQLLLNNRVVRIKSLDQAISLGIGYIGYNPTKNALFPDLTCLENLCYIASRKVKNFWMLNRYKDSLLNHFIDKFDGMDATKYIDEMSIFDRQRLVYYRWLAYKPDLIIIERPFTSVDQLLRQLTYELINELSNNGIAVILMSVNKAEMFTGRYYEMIPKENTPFSKE